MGCCQEIAHVLLSAVCNQPSLVFCWGCRISLHHFRALHVSAKLRSELPSVGLQHSLSLHGLSLLAQDTVNTYRM